MTWIGLGYSGPRDGMTRPQMRAVFNYLNYILLVNANDPDIDGIEAHHGDCTGGDAQFHVIAVVLGCRTVVHPPLNSSRRAWCDADEIREPKAYLTRDRDIANETGELLATPKTLQPVRGSGTWATIGYGVQLRRQVTLVDPDGRFGTPGAPVQWHTAGVLS